MEGCLRIRWVNMSRAASLLSWRPHSLDRWTDSWAVLCVCVAVSKMADTFPKILLLNSAQEYVSENIFTGKAVTEQNLESLFDQHLTVWSEFRDPAAFRWMVLICITLSCGDYYANSYMVVGPSTHCAVPMMHRMAKSPALHSNWTGSVDICWQIWHLCSTKRFLVFINMAMANNLKNDQDWNNMV